MEQKVLSLSSRHASLVKLFRGAHDIVNLVSSKIIAHVSSPSDERHVGVVQSSPFDYVRFSFRSGGASEFYQEMQNALLRKDWLKMPTVDSRVSLCRRLFSASCELSFLTRLTVGSH